MKKLLSISVCLALILGFVSVASVSISAVEDNTLFIEDDTVSISDSDNAVQDIAQTGAESELADNGSDTDIQSTGSVVPVNLGDSFYARMRMTKYNEYYVTVPAKAADTAILRKLNDYNSQVWHFTRDGNAYRIRSVATNQYLEMNSDTPKEAAYLYNTAKNNKAAQKWIISKDTTGYKIHSSIDANYVFVCVNPTATTSRVVLTTAVNHARSYFTIEKLSISSDKLETPTLRLVNQFGGILVDWNNVANATQYRLYRYNNSTKKWVTLADVKSSNYTDTNVTSGVTYEYAVKTISPVLSDYQEKSIMYIAAPAAWVNNTADGPMVCWKKVGGAVNYRVFVHNGTKWCTLGTTTDNTLLHKNFDYNKEYKYTVRCLTADGKSFTSAYDAAGVANTIVKTPVVTAAIAPFAFEVRWAKIDGAAKYRVFSKSAASSWKWVEAGDTAATSFTYSDTLSDNCYYFTVRALDNNGNLISGFSASKKYTFYEAPCVFDITSSSTYKKISWYPVDGAAKYRVYAWNGQKWITKGDTSSTSFNASITGTNDQNICYAVRCMNSSGSFISYYIETVIEADLRYYFPGEYSSKHKF